MRELTPVEQDWLDNTFRYHPPAGDEQVETYQRLREAGKEMAHEILASTPAGPERDKALDAVREAVMWANAGIACAPIDFRPRRQG